MSIKLNIFFLLIAFFCNYNLSAQRIIDSVEIYDFPVKKGVIYEYAPSFGCGSNEGIYVLTEEDSLFHFEDGKVVAVNRLESDQSVPQYILIIKSTGDNYICYGNLKSVAIKKGDRIKKGMFMGTIGQEDQNKYNEVYVVMLSDDVQYFSKKNIIEYIRCNTFLIEQNGYTL